MMARMPVPVPAQPVDEDPPAPRFARVVAAIVGLENYRKPSREGARFTFDLEKRRLEIAFAGKSALEFVDAAQQFQLGVGRSSPMLAAPSRRSRSADDEA